MRNVVKLFALTVMLLFSTSVYGQSIDVEELDPTELDFTLIDLSDVHLYFRGPLEFYMTGLTYGDDTYAAVLEYDGASTISVGTLEIESISGRPRAIDLSDVAFQLTESGIQIANLVIDGQRYSGALQVLPNNDLRIVEVVPGTFTDTVVSDLLRQIRSLERSIEQKNQRIARLIQQIEELPEPQMVQELRRQTSELEDQLAGAKETATSLETTLVVRNDRIESLEQQLSGLTATVRVRDERIARLSAQLEELTDPERIAELRSQVTKLEDDLQTAWDRIDALEARIGTKDREIRDLRDRVADLRDPWNIADELLPEVDSVTFADGTASLGSWNISRGTLVQSDPAQRFAKYVLPVDQRADSDLMYSLTGVADARGWSGYGLHFLATGSVSPNRYGYGESYLVWASRHPEVNRNDRTYVELYRSYDDVRMEKLASVAVNHPISTELTISAYVDREAGRLSVIVDGEEVFSFSSEALIRSGDSVAVRALGEIEITDLQVRSE